MSQIFEENNKPLDHVVQCLKVTLYCENPCLFRTNSVQLLRSIQSNECKN